MSIVIEDEKQFEELVTNYGEALEYIEYLESLLDAAVYQEKEFNKKFVRKVKEVSYGEDDV